MYDFISGNLAYVEETFAVIEAGGIGYRIFAVTDTLYKLPRGGEVCLYTYLHVKEDEMSLYGFAEREEREVFLKLISISGIGAKTAIGILSAVTVRNFTNLVAAGDANALSKIKGIGKKTAERIVLELAGKFSVVGAVEKTELGSAQQDAVFALVSLGLSQNEAERRVAALKGKVTTAEDYIALALRGF